LRLCATNLTQSVLIFEGEWFSTQIRYIVNTMGADKSLARPGWKQDTATEDFEFHISYL